MRQPENGSRWERNDEVFEVMSVYDAKQQTPEGGLTPVTLVKVVCVEPMPTHVPLRAFLDRYEPYDPDAE